jgi:hypothetical protein
LFRQDERWGIEVTDSGQGIPEFEIPHIFDTFRQVDDAATREHGGFGLGLSIVKQLVGLMNGEINVTSILGEGSVFLIRFPLIIPQESPKAWRGLMNKLALIIEDDEDLANIFAEALRGIGFEVENALDGRSCARPVDRWRNTLSHPAGYAPAAYFGKGITFEGDEKRRALCQKLDHNHHRRRPPRRGTPRPGGLCHDQTHSVWSIARPCRAVKTQG